MFAIGGILELPLSLLPTQLPSGIAAVPCNGNLTQQFGNRGMRPVLTFFVKINRAVLGQLCTRAQELRTNVCRDNLKHTHARVVRISIYLTVSQK